MISQSTLDTILQTAPIEEVVGRFVTLKKDGPRLRGFCPFHNEKTPSFTVTPAKAMYKCFGCGAGGNVFNFIEAHEKKTFPEAVRFVASMFNLPVEDTKGEFINPEKCKPDLRQRDAEAAEEDGTWLFEIKEPTAADIKFVISAKVWDYLLKTASRIEKDQTKEFTADEREASALKKAKEIFTAYHFHCLTSYSIVKNRKVTIIRATEHFPIFMFDEKDWKKIYKPQEPEKKNRFIYYGKRPTHFIHGLEIVGKEYARREKKLMDETEEGEEQTKDAKAKKAQKESRLPEVILCSGGSDGLNLAMLGHYPLWMNSESQKLSHGDFKNLQTKAEKIYHVPDIDKTGLRQAHELALEFLELRTINLPAELKLKTVARGKGKDVRDFFKFYTAWDFLELMKVAYPYRFWNMRKNYNKQGEYTGMSYNVMNKYLLNFLAKNGFYRFKYEAENEGYIYIFIKDNVVKQVKAKDIRDYINAFLEQRKLEVELLDTFLRTTQLNETQLSNLPFIEIDFSDFDKTSQWMFFQNATLKITGANIEELSVKDCDKYVWHEEVIPHEIEKLHDFFTITRNEQTGYDIEIKEKKCPVLNYLTNASRIFWRDELETRLEGIADEKERQRYCETHTFTKEQVTLANGLPKADWDKYREEHKWNIAGPLLTEDEIKEQKLHLINKIYALGYLLHRYRDNSRAWCVWAMDNKITEMAESHGGSGKSISLSLAAYYMKTEAIGGRDQKVTEDKHIWGNVTKHTDFVFVDDCSQYLRFDFFYPSITGTMTCNPKNSKIYSLPFPDVPKMGFASNYPPWNIDPSGERRILYTVFSDYYHANRFEEYKQERQVSDDFGGRNLIRDFTEEEWQYTNNFMAQCIRFYLSAPAKINPPMDNVNKRNLKAEMGDAFQSWCDVFFSEEAGMFNKFIPREELFENFRKVTRQQYTPQKFLKSIKAWCHYNGHEFNPKQYVNESGRIIRKHKGLNEKGETEETTKEMFYIEFDKHQLKLDLHPKPDADEDLPF